MAAGRQSGIGSADSGSRDGCQDDAVLRPLLLARVSQGFPARAPLRALRRASRAVRGSFHPGFGIPPMADRGALGGMVLAPDMRARVFPHAQDRAAGEGSVQGSSAAAPHTLPPAPLSPKVGEGWRSRGEGTSSPQLQARARGQPPSHFPSPPGPLSHGASLGRGGASGVPVAHTTNHTSHAPPSSPLPESGRGVAKPG